MGSALCDAFRGPQPSLPWWIGGVVDWFACLRVVAGCAGPNFALSLCAAATVQLLALPCSASSIQTAQVEMEETEHCVHHLESDQTALLRCRNPSRRGEPAQLMQLAS